jgi:hypothetical protein
MEGEGKSKKVAKEKRSVKKSTSVTLPAKEISAAPVANPAAAAPIGKDKSAKTKPAKKATRSGNVREPTFEEIQLQAYHIGERRKKYGIPGDATSDWVEAEITLKAKFV